MSLPTNPIACAFLVASVLVSGCGSGGGPDGEENDEPTPASKITFDTGRLDERGLAGPPDGLRSLMYEFCIPRDSARIADVRAIDPSVRVYPGSPGRIGCRADQALCIGETHQPGWRDVLDRLAGLAWIERIDESYAE